MKIRQAKKIIYSRRWFEKMSTLNPGYHNPESGCYIQPSLHNVPNRTFQKARKRYFSAAKRYFARHGRCFDDKMLLI